MIIRTFVPLLVAGVFKYVASRILLNEFEKMIEESLRKREQQLNNDEASQSET